MLAEQMHFDLGSPEEQVKCVAFAPSSCALYSRVAVATRFFVYIYAVMYEKLVSTNKYHLKDRPVLIGKLADEPEFEIVSLLWNNQGSSLSVQYNDGRIFVYQRKLQTMCQLHNVRLEMFNYCWKRTAIIPIQSGLPNQIANFMNQ
jgi:hypothetical protein